ncbi:MAG: DNA helicase PcrA [Lachnospiraceae bacterium]|nr:DNA helicase PcrA [Lachnospiraceae bacterium]
MNLLDTLNKEQREAASTITGPLLIIAGAGSGKTRVLTHRIAYLIEEEAVNPWNILAITFTNKAAGEMRERVDKMVGYGSESIWVATFHSTCVRILRRYIDRIGYDTNFTIYDTDDSKTVMKEVCKRLQYDPKQIKERALLNAISSAKNELIGPKEFALNAQGDLWSQKVADAYAEYQKTLHKSNALDFDDLLMLTVELFRSCPDVLENYQNRFQYIMVDEYQDTNTAQFELIRLLADTPEHNLCVVGDDDQSIYKFRGANIHNILDFEKTYPEAKVVKLEQNYRSTQNILSAANAVIRNNMERKDKALWSDQGEGDKIHFKAFESAYDEAEFIAGDIARKCKAERLKFGDFAVLYRTNAQSRLLEEQFVMEGMPYQVVGGVNFYSRKEIKDVLAYLKTIDNGLDDVAVRRILNVPKRGIGATTIARVQDFAAAKEISFFEALLGAEEIPGLGKGASKLVNFTTMIRAFRGKMKEYSLRELLADVLETTGYLEELKTSGEEDAEDRVENVEELVSKLAAYEESAEQPTLSGFLEEVALVADIDTVGEEGDRTLLMTLHAAKGLEFEHVYIAGMEDGLFPGYMTISSDDPSDMEEERRLAYVGITRAKKHLTLCAAQKRMIHGETQYNPISRFIREIPEDLLDRPLPEKKSRAVDEFFDDNDSLFSGFGSRSSGYGAEDGYGHRTRETVPDRAPGNGVNYGSSGTFTKAVHSYNTQKTLNGLSRKTPESRKPFIAKGVSGLSKGMPVGIKPSYDVGDRVKHIKYGEGVVTALEKREKDYQVTVSFDEAGQKIMYAGFAKLQRIE